MKNAITWFEIGTANLAKATAFYGTVLGHNTDLDGNRVGLHSLA